MAGETGEEEEEERRKGASPLRPTVVASSPSRAPHIPARVGSPYAEAAHAHHLQRLGSSTTTSSQPRPRPRTPAYLG
eukprot:CAMPEP_0170147684 /NCGR_PEP_ID=MMETSP0033_2-20121228/35495_1 /TAXON_ID=195969 /ORGANISM="Dolichomastix tenuilepis, Strain CCMP3274" /LENGTH=76 /DNA_ID=CAMNT_0010384521 /DNA_START=44 /DNA_END=271 /DNA_ORIENTATION=-